jgi:hypothetical protein
MNIDNSLSNKDIYTLLVENEWRCWKVKGLSCVGYLHKCKASIYKVDGENDTCHSKLKEVYEDLMLQDKLKSVME